MFHRHWGKRGKTFFWVLNWKRRRGAGRKRIWCTANSQRKMDMEKEWCKDSVKGRGLQKWELWKMSPKKDGRAGIIVTVINISREGRWMKMKMINVNTNAHRVIKTQSGNVPSCSGPSGGPLCLGGIFLLWYYVMTQHCNCRRQQRQTAHVNKLNYTNSTFVLIDLSMCKVRVGSLISKCIKIDM